MLKSICFFAILVLVSSCSEDYKGAIDYANEKIEIDGSGSDKGWQDVEWRAIDQNWLGAAYTDDDFKGRYKLTWSEDQLFVLAEIIDDKLIDLNPDGLANYWDDDCLEVFIDEDASGGNHQYNYNAFAYHISLDNKFVDIGTDSLPHYYDHINCVRKTNQQTSVWELSMKLYDDTFQLGKVNKEITLQNKKEIGFAIAYCDNDNSDARENFIGSAKVEGEDKNRGWIDAGIFEKFILRK